MATAIGSQMSAAAYAISDQPGFRAAPNIRLDV